MTRQELETLIKRASDKMRADDNTKLVTKYIEHISWLLFLKVFEVIEDEREVLDPGYARVLEDGYQWSDWARRDWSASDLINFIHQDLFPYLRGLNTTPLKGIIATVFSGITTVMKSGFTLKEVIATVDEMEFHSIAEVHTLSLIYESLLARFGSEAGWSGEFYTPRPIVELMVTVTAPAIGERVYDPATGSGGFLVEAFEHMRQSEETLQDHQQLQEATFYGQESGELPFLLGTMNLILHGLTSPTLVRRNTLEEDIRQIRAQDQFDIVLTNPPFGGTENPQVQQNFPLRSSSTQLLFMQHILGKLKRSGRAAVVLPESFLSNEDVFQIFRRRMVDEWNVHTIVSLPAKGIWYKPVKTVLLFLTGGEPSPEILYVEVSPPEGQKNFTKRKPLTREVLEPYLELILERKESGSSWLTSLHQLEEQGLDLRPQRPSPDPQLSLADARTRLVASTPLYEGLGSDLSTLESAMRTAETAGISDFELVPLRAFLRQSKDKIMVRDTERYKRVREPRRESWRLHPLRGWSHDQVDQVPARDPRTSSPDGVRA
jgi:type I restriction enzyme M protein